MGSIDITKNTSVRLGNIGQVRQAYAGDFSAPAKALGKMGEAVGGIGKLVGNIAVDMQERENAAKVNEAMSSLLIGSGRISDGILSDGNLSPSEYQNRFKEDYDKLYGEVTKDLNSAQLEKMRMAASRVYTSSMVSLGHTAMQRTVAQEKASAANLCAAAKIRAVNSPNEETIGFYLGAFTDAEKDAVREIHALEEAGKTKEAAALREALRIRQTQGVDEILGESAMNEIKAAEDAGDEAALEALAKNDWRKSAHGIDPTDGKEKILSPYDQMLGREGFGDKTAHILKSQAETALRRVRSAKEKAQYDTRVANEKRYYDELAEERMNVIDPERIGNSAITVSAYRKKLDADSSLDPQTKRQMLAEAASIEKYRTDYWEAIKKHEEEVKDKIDKHNSQYGFFTKDGKNADGSDKWTFHPSTAFPKTTDTYAAKRFAYESPIWNDPNHARIELKAAAVSGSVSEAFFKERLKHCDTMLDEKSRQAWEKIFPSIKDLVKSGYGKKELSSSEMKYRKENSIPEAIWAKRGIAGSPVDWVADSLEYNGGEDYDNGTEEFIPLEVMSQIEDTVQRLSRNGVDPTEAIRQIIAPTIEMGFRRNLVERLKDEQFFNAIVDRFNLENNTAAKMKAATSHYLKNRTEKSFVSDNNANSKKD
jgi:hypothetical protein